MFRIEPRAVPSKTAAYLSPLIAAGLMFLTCLVFTRVMGQSTLATFKAFFISPIRDLYGISELLLRAVPLILIGLGLSFGFRSRVWNIGAEGQLTLGAIFGSGVALYFYGQEGAWILPGILVAGILGGILWALIPALLRTRFNANEILVSLMLNYVALLLLSYLVHGPWRSPEGYNFPETRLFSDSALLPMAIEGTRLHIGIYFTLAAVILSWIFIQKGFVAFQMKTAGLAEHAAEYAGFSRRGMVWLAFLLGGAAAGLAGATIVTGPIGQLTPKISPGYGYAAIIVAFIGRLHPVGIALSGLLLSLLYLGGESAQIELGLPAAVTGIFQGMLLIYLLASEVSIKHRFRWRGFKKAPIDRAARGCQLASTATEEEGA